MFPLYKLEKLPPGQRRRKIVLMLASAERSLAGGDDAVLNDEQYFRGLASLALEDPKLEPSAVLELERLLSANSGSLDSLRVCNYTRHALLAAIGSFPAEWDLVLPKKNLAEQLGRRFFYPGVSVYAEDIRSPFNLGSIFRTAEAFGAEKVMISPLCVPPTHPRAQRSAMGCVDYIPWERISVDAIAQDIPVFALETGGISLDEFVFPPRGVVIIGSEELGISPEGLSRAAYGRVSIPMSGMKASLNVGVAFGILMQAWTSYLCCSDSKPF